MLDPLPGGDRKAARPRPLVDALADAFVDLSSGRASMPQRVAAFSGDGMLGVMPAYLPSSDVLETKLVTLFEGTRAPTCRRTRRRSPSSIRSSGCMSALMDGTYITATRTAAGSALSTRVLAREDVRVLAICGTGVQAHTHARAVPRVRALRGDPDRGTRSREGGGARGGGRRHRLRLVRGGRPRRRRRVRDHALARAGRAARVGVARRARHVRRRQPARAGARRGAGGGRARLRRVARRCVRSVPGGRERAQRHRRRTTSPRSARCSAESGPAGTDAGQITLWKSVGVAVMDAAAVALVLRAAAETGAGTEVAL